MADSGFPTLVGGANIRFCKFSQKLHEIETRGSKILDQPLMDDTGEYDWLLFKGGVMYVCDCYLLIRHWLQSEGVCVCVTHSPLVEWKFRWSRLFHVHGKVSKYSRQTFNMSLKYVLIT